MLRLIFFYCPPTFGSPCILTALAKKLIFFIIRRDKESSGESPKSMAKSAKAFLRQL